MSATDLVWEERRYESGWYQCKVTRTGHDDARLTITLEADVDQILHDEPVKADRADTDKWRTRSLAVITNPDLRSIEYTR